MNARPAFPHRPTRRLWLQQALGLAIVPAWAQANAPVGDAQLSRWIQAAERVLRGRSSAAVMKMQIQRSDYQREYDLLVLSDDRDEQSKVLIRMLGPALWRGNATLKVGERISIYDPRTRRVTVMGSSMLADQWMGSHFTNDDLMRETDLARHYSYELQQRVAERDELDRPVERLSLQLRPKPNAPVAWGRVQYQLHLRDGDAVLPLQVDYFRRAGDAQAQRSLRYSRLAPIDGRPLPLRLTMQALDKPGEYTQIDYARLKFDNDFGADDFSERALR
ncbi:outer membrane lipoprotein-sorting protein [Roseateles sp. DAIF2]|uniref:outer membrane lipoprotein-sorting protein n=1 Tax=Roseateles sp. DAIF2 TaxID=2714952 RepID=UPI0018A29AA7|nr:outer membrane lipoprotein-sorting protein [Roseateles sp. DAIF2]QPF73611.1 outer membrane lipoprotein-sorting protein [Roseateles sp. DAIF2]